jgi:hypothetical protein
MELQTVSLHFCDNFSIDDDGMTDEAWADLDAALAQAHDTLRYITPPKFSLCGLI